MTEEEKDAFDDQWAERQEEFMDRKDRQDKDEWDMRDKAGYFKDMTRD